MEIYVNQDLILVIKRSRSRPGLNVAFIAMLIAREAGWEPLAIKDAGLAGLVHDIGELSASGVSTYCS